MQTAISVGATILGAFFGRKAISAGSIGRATTAGALRQSHGVASPRMCSAPRNQRNSLASGWRS